MTKTESKTMTKIETAAQAIVTDAIAHGLNADNLPRIGCWSLSLESQAIAHDHFGPDLWSELIRQLVRECERAARKTLKCA